MGRISPVGYVLVDEDTRGIGRRNVSNGDGVKRNVSSEAVTINEEVKVAGGGEKVVKRGSLYRLSGEFAGLSLEAVTYSPAGAVAHAWPPLEVTKEVENPSGAEVVGGVRMVGVYDLGEH